MNSLVSIDWRINPQDSFTVKVFKNLSNSFNAELSFGALEVRWVGAKDIFSLKEFDKFSKTFTVK